MTTPFLLCISEKNLGNAIEILEDWQLKHHGQKLGLLPQVEALKQSGIINAPDNEETEEIEVSREMRRPPSHQGKVK